MAQTIYAQVTFTYEGRQPWKDAQRFYQAARRREWWVTKDGRSVFVTNVALDDIKALLSKLALSDYEVS